MPKALKGVEIFSSGTWTDGKRGVTRNWTASEVKEIAANYQALKGRHTAPATAGHVIKPGDFALGWAEALSTVDTVDQYGRPVTKLLADFRDIDEALYDALEKRRLAERSAAFDVVDGKLTLHHVAFLGAELPAVKGLAPLAFASSDSELVYTYSSQNAQEGNSMEIKEMLEKLTTDVGNIGKRLARLERSRQAKADEDDDSGAKGKEGAKGTQHSEGNTGDNSSNPEIARLTKELAEAKAESQRAQFNEWLNRPEIKRRVTPKERPEVLAMLESLAGSGSTVEFSDGTNTVKKTALEAYKAQVETWPEKISTDEHQGNGGDSGGKQGAQYSAGGTLNDDEYAKAGEAIGKALEPVK